MSHRPFGGNADPRDYGVLATRLRSAAGTARALRKIAEGMEQTIAARREEVKTPADASRLAEAMTAAIGHGDRQADLQAAAEQLRTIGSAQDSVLSKCRLAARRLKQECRMAAGLPAEGAAFVAAVREPTEALLRKK